MDVVYPLSVAEPEYLAFGGGGGEGGGRGGPPAERGAARAGTIP